MLKEMGFCQQKIIQADDVKYLDNSSDDEEPQKELQKCEILFLSIHTADDEQTDISNKKQDQDDPAEDPFR